jgi:phospholipase/carboxylesterase
VTSEAVEVETGRNPNAAVIWLHGLGADGHDFEPVVPQLVQPHERALRFVFPHAPVRPVTLNNGYAMRAWYDIAALNRAAAEDERGIRASQNTIDALIRRENARGIASERIVLAGFSQGGAMALFAGTRQAQRLAGIMGLSCYLVLAARLAAERNAVNDATPIFLAHGLQDPVVAPELGAEARRQLQAAGYAVEWHAYSMPHAVCPQEILDIAAWLRRVLP